MIKDKNKTRIDFLLLFPAVLFLLLVLSAVFSSQYLYSGPAGTAAEKISLDQSAPRTPDIPLTIFIGVQVFVAAALFLKRRYYKAAILVTEGILTLGIMLGLFFLFYAQNANIDYVQRFALTSDVLSFQPDSSAEQRLVLVRYLPLCLADLLILIHFASMPPVGSNHRRIDRWGYLLVLVSSLLFILSFPSELAPNGIGALIYIALIPLILTLRHSSKTAAILRGITFGIFTSMVIHSWLATFSLVSLQFMTAVYTVFYTLFMIVLVPVYKSGRKVELFLLPVMWTAFDFLRAQGFLGFPWGMPGAALYRQTAVIQIAALTGIWGVTFYAVLMNMLILKLALELYPLIKNRSPLRGYTQLFLTKRQLSAALILFLLVPAAGGIRSTISERKDRNAEDSVRVALIQQNNDPRKSQYRETFNILKVLSDEALRAEPDLVVWSETAFVPNIRRWGSLSPKQHYLARLVDDLKRYQTNREMWLLTGNDDYELKESDGETVYEHYNASVFFKPDGTREDTYRKMKLVPFTESFPYRKQLPQLYDLLIEMDVNLWERGDRRVVFEHPKMAFSTPICFEDSFPGEVRAFVKAGAQAIINISNDYWSLTEIEGTQHFMNSLFRAVENNRPLLRATASGVTAYVSPAGVVKARIPQYKQGYLVVDVPDPESRGNTPYTLFGDWFPAFCLLLLAGFLGTKLMKPKGYLDNKLTLL